MIIQFSIVALNLSADGSTVQIGLRSVSGESITISLPIANPAVATLTIGRLVNVQFTVV